VKAMKQTPAEGSEYPGQRKKVLVTKKRQKGAWMPWCERHGMKYDEVVLLPPQAPEYAQELQRPKRSAGFISWTSASEVVVRLLGDGLAKQRVIADFKNSQRSCWRAGVGSRFHAVQALCCPRAWSCHVPELRPRQRKFDT
jgi:hypothetical protein